MATKQRDDLARGLVTDHPDPEGTQKHPAPGAEPQPDLESVPNHQLMESARKFMPAVDPERVQIPLGANPDNLPKRGDADPTESAAHRSTTYGVDKGETAEGATPRQSAARHSGKAGTGEPNHPTGAKK